MSKLNIAVSPHIKSPVTTQRIMLDVIIAMIPALIASIILFGIRSLLVCAFCVAVCVAAQYVFELLCKKETQIGDLSAVVTGMLLAFNLPVSIPLWQAAVGSIVAIVIVKELFGGIGHNFANPAITARVVMVMAFSSTMTAWVAPRGADLVSGATPLALITEGNMGQLPGIVEMLLGQRGGCLGETCIIALLMGGIYLIARGVIKWHTPVFFMGTVAVFAFIYSGFDLSFTLYQIISGGLVLGAFFMATDYATTPPTPLGKAVFGIGCGLITAVIRMFGSYPEGVSFAILLMNILTPYISNLTHHKIFGVVKAKKGGKKA